MDYRIRSKLLFFGLELFVNLIHLPPLFQQLGGRGNSLILVEGRKLIILFHGKLYYIDQKYSLFNIK